MGWQTISKSGEATRRRRGPRIGSFLLQTLNEMQMQRRSSKRPDLSSPACLATAAIARQPNTDRLTQPGSIRSYSYYIDERYASALTRESVAQAFIFRQITSRTCFKKRGPLVLTIPESHATGAR